MAFLQRLWYTAAANLNSNQKPQTRNSGAKSSKMKSLDVPGAIGTPRDGTPMNARVTFRSEDSVVKSTASDCSISIGSNLEGAHNMLQPYDDLRASSSTTSSFRIRSCSSRCCCGCFRNFSSQRYRQMDDNSDSKHAMFRPLSPGKSQSSSWSSMSSEFCKKRMRHLAKQSKMLGRSCRHFWMQIEWNFKKLRYAFSKQSLQKTQRNAYKWIRTNESGLLEAFVFLTCFASMFILCWNDKIWCSVRFFLAAFLVCAIPWGIEFFSFAIEQQRIRISRFGSSNARNGSSREYFRREYFRSDSSALGGGLGFSGLGAFGFRKRASLLGRSLGRPRTSVSSNSSLDSCSDTTVEKGLFRGGKSFTSFFRGGICFLKGNSSMRSASKSLFCGGTSTTIVNPNQNRFTLSSKMSNSFVTSNSPNRSLKSDLSGGVGSNTSNNTVGVYRLRHTNNRKRGRVVKGEGEVVYSLQRLIIQNFKQWRDSVKYLESSSGTSLISLVTTVTWCVIYVSSSFMFLSRKDVGAPWTVSFSQIPRLITELEGVILWIVTLEFQISFISAESKPAFLSSVSTWADIICLGPCILLMQTFFLDYGVTVDGYLLQLGWLRFMRFYGAEAILGRLFPWVSQVRLQILGLLLELISLVCTFAGGIYFLEAHDNEEAGFTTFLDFVYFAIITISTVGYGDFSPTRKLSRLIVIVFVCLIFSLIPTKVSKITELLNSKPLMCGRMPPKASGRGGKQNYRSSNNQLGRSKRSETHTRVEHVLILGRATPEMILTILAELYSHYLVTSDFVNVPRYIVLLTPDARAISALEPFIRFAFNRYRVRLCAKYCPDYFVPNSLPGAQSYEFIDDYGSGKGGDRSNFFTGTDSGNGAKMWELGNSSQASYHQSDEDFGFMRSRGDQRLRPLSCSRGVDSLNANDNSGGVFNNNLAQFMASACSNQHSNQQSFCNQQSIDADIDQLIRGDSSKLIFIVSGSHLFPIHSVNQPLDDASLSKILVLYKKLNKKMSLIHLQVNTRNVIDTARSLGTHNISCSADLQTKILVNSACGVRGFGPFVSNLLRYGEARHTNFLPVKKTGNMFLHNIKFAMGRGRISQSTTLARAGPQLKKKPKPISIGAQTTDSTKEKCPIQGWTDTSLSEYEDSLDISPYILPLPGLFDGKKFGDVVYTLYEEMHIICVGLVRADQQSADLCNDEDDMELLGGGGSDAKAKIPTQYSNPSVRELRHGSGISDANVSKVGTSISNTSIVKTICIGSVAQSDKTRSRQSSFNSYKEGSHSTVARDSLRSASLIKDLTNKQRDSNTASHRCYRRSLSGMSTTKTSIKTPIEGSMSDTTASGLLLPGRPRKISAVDEKFAKNGVVISTNGGDLTSGAPRPGSAGSPVGEDAKSSPSQQDEGPTPFTVSPHSNLVLAQHPESAGLDQDGDNGIEGNDNGSGNANVLQNTLSIQEGGGGLNTTIMNEPLNQTPVLISEEELEDEETIEEEGFDAILSKTLINFMNCSRSKDEYLLHPGCDYPVKAGDLALVLCQMSEDTWVDLVDLTTVRHYHEIGRRKNSNSSRRVKAGFSEMGRDRKANKVDVDTSVPLAIHFGSDSDGKKSPPPRETAENAGGGGGIGRGAVTTGGGVDRGSLGDANISITDSIKNQCRNNGKKGNAGCFHRNPGTGCVGEILEEEREEEIETGEMKRLREVASVSMFSSQTIDPDHMHLYHNAKGTMIGSPERELLGNTGTGKVVPSLDIADCVNNDCNKAMESQVHSPPPFDDILGEIINDGSDNGTVQPDIIGTDTAGDSTAILTSLSGRPMSDDRMIVPEMHMLGTASCNSCIAFLTQDTDALDPLKTPSEAGKLGSEAGNLRLNSNLSPASKSFAGTYRGTEKPSTEEPKTASICHDLLNANDLATMMFTQEDEAKLGMTEEDHDEVKPSIQQEQEQTPTHQEQFQTPTQRAPHTPTQHDVASNASIVGIRGSPEVEDSNMKSGNRLPESLTERESRFQSDRESNAELPLTLGGANHSNPGTKDITSSESDSESGSSCIESSPKIPYVTSSSEFQPVSLSSNVTARFGFVDFTDAASPHGCTTSPHGSSSHGVDHPSVSAASAITVFRKNDGTMSFSHMKTANSSSGSLVVHSLHSVAGNTSMGENGIGIEGDKLENSAVEDAEGSGTVGNVEVPGTKSTTEGGLSGRGISERNSLTEIGTAGEEASKSINKNGASKLNPENTAAKDEKPAVKDEKTPFKGEKPSTEGKAPCDITIEPSVSGPETNPFTIVFSHKDTPKDEKRNNEVHGAKGNHITGSGVKIPQTEENSPATSAPSAFVKVVKPSGSPHTAFPFTNSSHAPSGSNLAESDNPTEMNSSFRTLPARPFAGALLPKPTGVDKPGRNTLLVPRARISQNVSNCGRNGVELLSGLTKLAESELCTPRSNKSSASSRHGQPISNKPRRRSVSQVYHDNGARFSTATLPVNRFHMRGNTVSTFGEGLPGNDSMRANSQGIRGSVGSVATVAFASDAKAGFSDITQSVYHAYQNDKHGYQVDHLKKVSAGKARSLCKVKRAGSKISSCGVSSEKSSRRSGAGRSGGRRLSRGSQKSTQRSASHTGEKIETPPPRQKRIFLYGIPGDIVAFLETLQACSKLRRCHFVTILYLPPDLLPMPSDAFLSSLIKKFASGSQLFNLKIVRGFSYSRREDLLSAGILQADSILLCTCPRGDDQSVLLAHAELDSLRWQHGTGNIGDFLDLSFQDHAVDVLMVLKNIHSMSILLDQSKWHPCSPFDNFQFAPYFASGRVFFQEMLYPLLCGCQGLCPLVAQPQRLVEGLIGLIGNESSLHSTGAKAGDDDPDPTPQPSTRGDIEPEALNKSISCTIRNFIKVDRKNFEVVAAEDCEPNNENLTSPCRVDRSLKSNNLTNQTPGSKVENASTCNASRNDLTPGPASVAACPQNPNSDLLSGKKKLWSGIGQPVGPAYLELLDSELFLRRHAFFHDLFVTLLRRNVLLIGIYRRRGKLGLEYVLTAPERGCIVTKSDGLYVLGTRSAIESIKNRGRLKSKT